MTSKYNIAILMATYNGQAYIADQILSIKHQLNCNVDIFYSDDVSTDNTQKICQNYGLINLNSEKIKFGSSAMNFFHLMLAFNKELYCQYDYILFSDQDDIWLPNKVVSAIRYLQNNSGDCYSGSFFAFENKKIRYVNKARKQTECDYLFASPGPGFTFTFTRSAFSRIASELSTKTNLQLIRWHDWYIYALARSAGLKWCIDKEAYALYRIHQNNDTGLKNSLRGMLFRVKFLYGKEYKMQVLNMPSSPRGRKIQNMLHHLTFSKRLYLISRMGLFRARLLDKLAIFMWLLIIRR